MDGSNNYPYLSLTSNTGYGGQELPVEGMRRRNQSTSQATHSPLTVPQSNSTHYDPQWHTRAPTPMEWQSNHFELSPTMAQTNSQASWGEIGVLVQHRRTDEVPWAHAVEQNNSRAPPNAIGGSRDSFTSPGMRDPRSGPALRRHVSGVSNITTDSGFASMHGFNGRSGRNFMGTDPNASCKRMSSPSADQGPTQSICSNSHVEGPPKKRARRSGVVERCSTCDKELKNRSEAQKHYKQHEKPYICSERGCPRQQEGFATQNDLERHKKSVHKMDPKVGNRSEFVCLACPQTAEPKRWPRKDNFKAHIERKHSEYNDAGRDDLLERSRRQRPPGPVSESGYLSQMSTSDQHDRQNLLNIGGPSDYPVSRTQSHQGEHIFPLDATISTDAMIAEQGTWTGAAYCQPNYTGAQDLPTFAEELDTVGAHSTDPLDNAAILSFDDYMDVFPPQITKYETTTDCSDVPQGKDQIQLKGPVVDDQRSGSSEHQRSDGAPYPCPECGKIKSRECDLRKHMKRHTRPYGCTATKCKKMFGSRNDWKRHEDSQHVLQDMWRCEFWASPNVKCGRLMYERESFEQHLEKDHGISDDALEQQCERMHLGREASKRFWCGFCNEMIETSEIPHTSAVLRRFNHIGDHFDKKGDHIDQWIDIAENKPKGLSSN